MMFRGTLNLDKTILWQNLQTILLQVYCNGQACPKPGNKSMRFGPKNFFFFFADMEIVLLGSGSAI